MTDEIKHFSIKVAATYKLLQKQLAYYNQTASAYC